jgi:hypothetical protein
MSDWNPPPPPPSPYGQPAYGLIFLIAIIVGGLNGNGSSTSLGVIHLVAL